MLYLSVSVPLAVVRIEGVKRTFVHICIFASGRNTFSTVKQLSLTEMPTLSPKKSGAFIASRARDVTILEDGINRVAREFSDSVRTNLFSPEGLMLMTYPHPPEANGATVEWIFVADVLNFSFWQDMHDRHYTVTHKGKTYTGYMALAAALTRALEEGIPITTASYYANITQAEVNKVFRSDHEAFPIPLAEKRLENLREAGRKLVGKFDGSFIKCITACNHSAEKLLQLIVAEFPSFRDEAILDGQKVSFYKRAQILVADIWGSFRGQGLGRFDDISILSMFADYRVPQVLVHFGALRYSPALEEKLKQNVLMENGDREEVELRGCSVHAVELIINELRKINLSLGDGFSLNSALIDFYLWDYRRQHAHELKTIPFHKVRCIYY